MSEGGLWKGVGAGVRVGVGWEGGGGSYAFCLFVL